ncbi:MAG: hypothetical protein M3340_15765, partial [Actinomycetota bacterium]|nr:hypothetical protein [Actinomycetota bacterium]
MDLQAPGTLFTAWVLVPLAVVLASAGLGYGIALVSGVRLRALTIPTGFLAGIALFTVLYHVNVAGWATVALTVIAAGAGPLYALRQGRRPRDAGADARRGFLWA